MQKQGYSLSKLAKAFGISRSRVHQIIHADAEKVKSWRDEADLPALIPQRGTDPHDD